MHSESPNLPINLFSRISAFFVVILGATVIIGWHTKNILLLQVLPNAVPMQYTSALGFLMTGRGLLLAFTNKRKASAIKGVLLCIIGINKSQILIPVKQIILRISFFFIVVLFLFIIIIYYASNRLAQRILKLNSATNQITIGNLDTQNVTQTNDEVGVHSQNFALMKSKLRFMVNELNRLNDQLEVKVKERIHQLEEALNEIEVTQEVTKESEEKSKTIIDSSALLSWIVEVSELKRTEERLKQAKELANP